MSIPFEKCRFVKSALEKKDYPPTDLFEMALVGRSNVGKSSLLNHLTSQKMLAKISSKPGKTRLINFFVVEEALSIVDLPGYGFAKVSKTEKELWSRSIETYLKKRTQLGLILQLLDLRHPPTEDDLEFAHWAQYYGKPVLFVFTKVDKCKKQEILKLKTSHLQLLSESGLQEVESLLYSTKCATFRDELKRAITNKVCHN